MKTKMLSKLKGGLIGCLSRLVSRSHEWRANIQTVDDGEYQWETWTYWCWRWQWCKIGYENIWYDGPHRIFSFGVGTLATCWDCGERKSLLTTSSLLDASLTLTPTRNLNRIPSGLTRVECGGWLETETTMIQETEKDYMEYKDLYCKGEVEEIYERAEKEKSKAFLLGWVIGAMGMCAFTEIVLPRLISLF